MKDILTDVLEEKLETFISTCQLIFRMLSLFIILHEDFDMKNPRDPWRPQFRVNPKIRKMEFRLFDAPIDVYESSLQIKLVRAMLNLALNESTPLEGKVQRVNHEGFSENYERANRALKKCVKL